MGTLPGGVRLKGDSPSWQEKRDILADESAPKESLVALGGIVEGRGQLEEAATFYARGGDTAALERLRRAGVESGDCFLWLTACRLLGALPFPEDEARALADRAKGLGKLFDARNAFKAIEDEESVAAIESEIPTALPMKPVEHEVADAVEEFEASQSEHDGSDDAGTDDDGTHDDAPGPDDDLDEGSTGIARLGG